MTYTITQMEAQTRSGIDVFSAHRGGSLDWSEMTMWAYNRAAAWGCQILEVSVHRSLDGVLIMSHDDTMTRTTALDSVIAETNAADLLNVPVDEPYPGGVIGRVEDVLDQYPHLVLMVDNKPMTGRPAFINLLKTVPNWQEHIIVKVDGSSPVAVIQEYFNAGFKVAAYWFTNSNWTNVPSKLPYVHYPGLNYDASQALWDDLKDLSDAQSLLDGIYRPLWGHVLTSRADYLMAKAKGAVIFQAADVLDIVPQHTPVTRYAKNGTPILSYASNGHLIEEVA